MDMSFFDGLTEVHFKKDDSGNILFFPRGIWGSGYIIESQEKLDKIKKYYRDSYWIIYKIVFPTFIFLQVIIGMGLLLLISLLPFYYIYNFYKIKSLTKNSTKTNEKLKLSEAQNKILKLYNLPTLILMGIISVLFAISGFWILFFKKDFMGILPILLFGFGAILSVKMIIQKLKNETIT